MRFEDYDGASDRPKWPVPSDISEVVTFVGKGIGASEWVTLRGSSRPYYFNLDKAYSHPDNVDLAKPFHDGIAKFLAVGPTIESFKRMLNGKKPVLAYICPEGSPIGIAQARGAMAERLDWPSVLVLPERRLLRSRVITGRSEKDFPDSAAWLAGRQAFLICDAVTTGESVARGMGALRAFGCSSMAAVAVFNRDEGAQDSLALLNLPLYGIVIPGQVKKVISVKKLAESVESVSSHKTIRDYSIEVGQSS